MQDCGQPASSMLDCATRICPSRESCTLVVIVAAMERLVGSAVALVTVTVSSDVAVPIGCSAHYTCV
jgi:hypothetical protein